MILRALAAYLREPLRAAYPHALGLGSIGAIAVSLGSWLGWQVGMVVMALPFAAFYVAGQALEVMRHIPRE